VDLSGEGVFAIWLMEWLSSIWDKVVGSVQLTVIPQCGGDQIVVHINWTMDVSATGLLDLTVQVTRDLIKAGDMYAKLGSMIGVRPIFASILSEMKEGEMKGGNEILRLMSWDEISCYSGRIRDICAWLNAH
jgi:hypothetical protein